MRRLVPRGARAGEGPTRTLLTAAVAGAVAAAVLAGVPSLVGGSTSLSVQDAPATAYSFVADTSVNSVTEYAEGANGDVAPVATIAGPATGLDQPDGVAIDSSGDLFVANSGLSAPSITEYARGASGDVAPVATIAGPRTGLGTPEGLALDPSGNLFVSVTPSNSVVEFARGASGDVAPLATIAGPRTGLKDPVGLAFDPAGTLFVSNAPVYGTQTVTEYPRAATGDVAPVATIGGPRTGLSSPAGLAVSSSGNLFVANDGKGNSVDEYARGASGDVAPVASIAGSGTALSNPWGLAVDPSGDLFVANFNGSSVTEYPRGAGGGASPVADTAGATTGLSHPAGLALLPDPLVALPPGATRLAGQDRYGTAVAVAEAQFPSGVPSRTAILAVGRDFNLVDALAVAPLAKAMDVPVLLAETPADIGPATTAALGPLGVDRVVLVGAAQGLAGHLPAGISVGQVVAGTDRYGTAAAIAAALRAVEGVTSFPKVILTSGSAGHLVDAISVGPAAAATGAPVLLVPTTANYAKVALPPVEEAAVNGASVAYTVGVAGSDTVTNLPGGITVTTLFGADRYDTSAAVDSQFFPRPSRALIGNGSTQNMVDALAAGGYGGQLGAPVVLSDFGSLEASVAGYLRTLPAPPILTVLGGPLSIPSSAVVTIQAAAG